MDQDRDVKVFSKEYVGEELLSPFINYPVMNYFYLIQVIDLGFHVDRITPEKIQFFQEYRADPANGRICEILIRHKEIEIVSDGNKVTENKIKKTIFTLKEFTKK